MLHKKVIDFGKFGLKWVTRKWDTTTPSNFNENLEILSKLTTELYCIYGPLKSVYEVTPRPDVLVIDPNNNNKEWTPDLALLDNMNNIVKAWDFKCSLYNFTNARLQQLKDSLKYPFPVELIPIVMNLDFANTIKDKELREAYKIVLADVKSILPILSRNQLAKMAQDLHVMPELEEILRKHPKVQSIKDDQLKIDEFMEIPEIVEEFLKHIGSMEEFVNHNFLETKDLIQGIPKPTKINIFSDHPWNRDANKVKTSFKRNVDYTWGHKAEILYQAVPNKLIIKRDLKHFMENHKNPNYFDQDLLSFIKHISTFHIINEQNINKIKDINKLIAFIKTEADAKSIQELESDFGLTTERISTKLKKERTKIIMEMEASVNHIVHISKHGNPMLINNDKLRNKLGINKRTNLNFKVDLNEYSDLLKTDQDENIEIDDETLNTPNINVKKSKPENDCLEFTNWFTFDKVQEFDDYFDVNTIELDIEPYLNAYFENKNISDISNELAIKAVVDNNSIIKTKQFASIYSYIQLYRAIIMAAPRFATKGYKNNEGILTIHPEGYNIFVTAAPNEITSGIIVLFGSVKKKLPDWCPEAYYTKVSDEEYTFITKPFRINLKIANSVDSNLGSYIGCSVLSECLNFNIHKSWFYTSFWWAYVRQLALVFDIVYLFYKNTYNIGTIGKTELKSKFKAVQYRDVRVTSLYNLLFENYERFHYEVFQSLESNPMVGIIDPLFNAEFKSDVVVHTGWQSFLFVNYLKQIFLKNDGFDEAKLMGGFFEDELTYQEWYDNSDFNSSKLDPNKSLPMDKFFKMLMKDNNKDWAKLSYHPDTCFRINELLIKEALEKKPDISPHRDWFKTAITTGKSSKCMIAEEQHLLYDVNEKFEEQYKDKQKYKGLVSSNLSEALILEDKLFKRHVENDFLKGEDSPWSSTIKFSLGDRGANMVELALFESLLYPECCILVMVAKEQTGYGKRNFFVQNIFNRNANKVWDETLRPVLKELPEDMILIPGGEKYIIFEKDMKDLMYKRGDCMISIDATKFGDTYMVETFKLQILAMEKTGYVTTNEAKMLLYFAKCLHQRIVLMPWHNAKAYKQSMTEKDKEEISDSARKWVYNLHKYSNKLESYEKFKSFSSSHIMQRIKENPCFEKNVGFILGVFNMNGSMYTTGYCRMATIIQKRLGLMDISRDKTHSDDAVSIMNTKPPTAKYFKVKCVTSLVNLLLKENIMIFFDGTNYSITLKGQTTIIEEEVISKLHIILLIFTPRLVSQRPSLLKWGWGKACEVLQIVCFDNKTYVPLIRYAAAIGRDLPGKSPSSDTSMAMGRIYDILTNGGTQRCSSSLMVSMNFLIGDMYGLNQNKRNVAYPPEYNGLWWAIPAFVMEQGFWANEVRLFSTKNKVTVRTLQLAYNTKDVWKQRIKRNVLEKMQETIVKDTNFEDELTSSGAIETRKDFFIRYNKNKKTSLGLFKLEDAFRDNLNKYTQTILKEPELKDTHQQMMKLNEYWKLQIMAGSNLFSHQIINTMKKYTTTSWQENYIRTTNDVRMVSKLGYNKRTYPNPFSEYINTILKIQNEDPKLSYTIEEIYETLAFLAKLDFEIPDQNKTGYALTYQILTNYISDTVNSSLYYTIEKRLHTESLPVFYVKVPNTFIYGIYSIKALAVIYELRTNPQLSIRDTTIAKIDPRIINEQGFSEQIDAVRKLIDSRGFTAQDILDNFKLLSRLLATKMFHGVIKLPGIEQKLQSALGVFWDWNVQRDYYKQFSEKVEIEDFNNIQDLSIKSIKRMDRIQLAILWMHLIQPEEVPLNGVIKYNDKPIVVDRPEVLFNRLLKEGFSKAVANLFFTSLLYKFAANKRAITTFILTFIKIKNFTYKKIIYAYAKIIKFKFSTYNTLYVTLLYQNDDDFKYAIFVEDDGVDESAIKVNGNFILAISQFASYYTVKKRLRLKSRADILRGKGNFAVFFPEIVYKESGPDNWDFLEINLDVPEFFRKLNFPFMHNILVGYLLFKEKEVNVNNNNTEFDDEEELPSHSYLISPWRVSPENSGLTYHVNNRIVLSDVAVSSFCTLHDWYLSENLFQDNVFDNIPIRQISIIVDVLAIEFNLKEARQYFNLIQQDAFAPVVKIIRELEIEIGITFSALLFLIIEFVELTQINLAKIKRLYDREYNSNTRSYSKNKFIHFDLTLEEFIIRQKLFKLIVETKAKLQSEAINSDEIKFHWLCMYIIIDELLSIADENRTFIIDEKLLDIRYTFLPREINYEINAYLKDSDYLQVVDLIKLYITSPSSRFINKNGMPISIFKMIISTSITLNKAASFLLAKESEMYSATAIDKTYFMNLKKCVGNPNLKKIQRFMSIV